MTSPLPAPEQPCVVGLDVGGTNMQFGVVDATHTIVGRARCRTNAERGVDHVLDMIERGVHDACRDADIDVARLTAIGTVCAGAIDMDTGVVLSAPNLRWTDVPLRSMIADRLGRPAFVDNDVNGAAWGEYCLGAAAGYDDALAVWVGTGIGAGLILGGRVHHGAGSTAGELGQTILMPGAPVGARTVEDHCSRTGLRRIIGERLAQPFAEHANSVLHRAAGGDPSRLGTADLAGAYESGDALATAVIDESAEWLGIAIANCVTLLALPVVVLGGGITEALGAPYLARVRKSFDDAVFPTQRRECVLAMTTLAADAGILGAALMARAGSASR